MIDLHQTFPVRLLKLSPEILAHRHLYARFYQDSR